jgi:hypothetical protein
LDLARSTRASSSRVCRWGTRQDLRAFWARPRRAFPPPPWLSFAAVAKQRFVPATLSIHLQPFGPPLNRPRWRGRCEPRCLPQVAELSQQQTTGCGLEARPFLVRRGTSVDTGWGKGTASPRLRHPMAHSPSRINTTPSTTHQRVELQVQDFRLLKDDTNRSSRFAPTSSARSATRAPVSVRVFRSMSLRSSVLPVLDQWLRAYELCARCDTRAWGQMR